MLQKFPADDILRDIVRELLQMLQEKTGRSARTKGLHHQQEEEFNSHHGSTAGGSTENRFELGGALFSHERGHTHTSDLLGLVLPGDELHRSWHRNGNQWIAMPLHRYTEILAERRPQVPNRRLHHRSDHRIQSVFHSALLFGGMGMVHMVGYYNGEDFEKTQEVQATGGLRTSELGARYYSQSATTGPGEALEG